MNPQKINELEQKIGNLLYRQTAIYCKYSKNFC